LAWSSNMPCVAAMPGIVHTHTLMTFKHYLSA